VTIESTLISTGGPETGAAPFTVVTFHLPAKSPLTFRLGQETNLSRVAAALGGQDVALGDHAFDRAFVVKSNHPAALKQVFTPEVRRAAVSSIERAKKRVGQLTDDVMELTLDGEKLTWTTLGRVESPWELGREGFDMLVQIARNVGNSEGRRWFSLSPTTRPYSRSWSMNSKTAREKNLKTSYDAARGPRCDRLSRTRRDHPGGRESESAFRSRLEVNVTFRYPCVAGGAASGRGVLFTLSRRRPGVLRRSSWGQAVVCADPGHPRGLEP